MVIEKAFQRAGETENSAYDILFQNDLLRFGFISKKDGRSWYSVERDILTELLAVAEEWYIARDAVQEFLENREAERNRIDREKAINNITFMKRLASAKTNEQAEQARHDYEFRRRELEEEEHEIMGN